MRRSLTAISFLLILFGAAQIITLSASHQYTPKIEYNTDRNNADNQGKISFIEKAISDPVEISTVIIALFTVVLGIGTGFLVLDGRNHSRNSLRAYVFADTAGFLDGGFPEGKDPIKELRGQVQSFIHIKNSGQTPAYKLAHWGAIGLCPPSEQDKVLIVPKINSFPQNTLPPGGLNSKYLLFPGNPISESDIKDIVSRNKLLYLYGRIEYTDMSGRLRFTNYRLSFGGSYPPYGRIGLIYSDRGNESD